MPRCASSHSGNSSNNASAQAFTSFGNCTFGLIALKKSVRLSAATVVRIASPTHSQNNPSVNCAIACDCQNSNCCSLNFAGDFDNDSILNCALNSDKAR